MCTPSVFARALTLAAIAPSAAASPPPPDDLRTAPERTGWRETTRSDDVVALLDGVARASPLARRAEMGRSFEGREIPLLILADPPIATAEEARRSGKVVFLAFANIHAGEVDAKEAVLMFAREVALRPEEPGNRAILDNLVLVLAPNYNPDGEERRGETARNRPGQVGPEGGVGTRANTQGFDLNRDYIKAEAPETRAMLRFMNEWDPLVLWDGHTTNGSRHRYTLTFEAPLHPGAHPAPVRLARESMLPAAARRVRADAGFDLFWYGDFNGEHTTWSSYSHLPRFGGNYHGLRGRVSILSESYSYAGYEDRVRASLAFLRACVEHAAADPGAIRAAAREADADAIRMGADAALAARRSAALVLRAAPAAFDAPAVVKGFAVSRETDADGNARWAVGDAPFDHTVAHVGRFEPTLRRERPSAYYVSADSPAVALLRLHGARVEPLDAERPARVGVARVDAVALAERPFQGRRLATLTVTWRDEDRRLGAGWARVPMDQPLGTLVGVILEPESDDGAAAWGLLGDAVREGADYPVLKERPALQADATVRENPAEPEG